ncbi:ATPase [Sphingobacteriaceae bacterium]|nr:ATPase [Sphingobacteriaceae bacterium]
MNVSSTSPASSSDCEIITTRIIDAHQELVYKAWTDPEHLKNWWGPKGFTNSFHKFDLEIGGRWVFTMHGPDKRDYNNEVEFIQIVAPELLIWKRHTKPYFQVVTTFSERPGHKTELTFKMIFDDPQTCKSLKPVVVPSNEENFDRLEEELLKMKEEI